MRLTKEMLQVAPINTLTKKEVMARWKVSAYFIEINKVAMGGRGKPVLFDQLLVEAFFRDYFRTAAIKKLEADEKAEALSRELRREAERLIGAEKVQPIKRTADMTRR